MHLRYALLQGPNQDVELLCLAAVLGGEEVGGYAPLHGDVGTFFKARQLICKVAPSTKAELSGSLAVGDE